MNSKATTEHEVTSQQPPNSYMTEQTIEIHPFNKQNNTNQTTEGQQKFFLSSKHSATENATKPPKNSDSLKFNLKKHSLQQERRMPQSPFKQPEEAVPSEGAVGGARGVIIASTAPNEVNS